MHHSVNTSPTAKEPTVPKNLTNKRWPALNEGFDWHMRVHSNKRHRAMLDCLGLFRVTQQST